MRHTKLTLFVLLVGLLLPTVWCGATHLNSFDGFSHIVIKEGDVHGIPKGSSIQASINGHWLSVVFLENLGLVDIEISSLNNNEVQIESTPTPNGVNIYIFTTGSYIVTFTLPNGDEYYGEFEIME